MKRSAILLLAFSLLPTPALAQIGCGIKPIAPIPQVGCIRMEPVCVCSAEGRCFWQFVCIRR